MNAQLAPAQRWAKTVNEKVEIVKVIYRHANSSYHERPNNMIKATLSCRTNAATIRKFQLLSP